MSEYIPFENIDKIKSFDSITKSTLKIYADSVTTSLLSSRKTLVFRNETAVEIALAILAEANPALAAKVGKIGNMITELRGTLKRLRYIREISKRGKLAEPDVFMIGMNITSIMALLSDLGETDV